VLRSLISVPLDDLHGSVRDVGRQALRYCDDEGDTRRLLSRMLETVPAGRATEPRLFAENFDAETGAGLRDRVYTWTASSYLIPAAANERRQPGQA
jgi:hypothetical protein